MRTIYLSLLGLSLSLISYSQIQTSKKENGWYHIINKQQQDSTEINSNQLDSKSLWEEANRYRATITDSTFLRTKGIMSDKAIDPLVSEGWNKNYAYNQVVYLKALERAKHHLVVKDNQLICSLKSGKEINISEDLYLYIYRLFDDWNRWVATGQYKIIKEKNGFYDIVPYKQQ